MHENLVAVVVAAALLIGAMFPEHARHVAEAVLAATCVDALRRT